MVSRVRLWFAAGVLVWGVGVGAQDTRRVVEPVLPPACVVLDARLTTHAGQIARGDEGKLDTERIQRALDGCGRGHGVVLRAAEGHDAFLSGPLELREGVTLVVGQGATLFGSRDPAVYAIAPGSCGVVNHESPGCRPLIEADHVRGAGVMGEGTIDGRGDATLLGEKVSWWNLAEQARAGGRQQVPRILVANYADDFTIYRITLKNSPNFHVVYNHGDGLTVWGLKIDTPQRGARNTDGVDPGDGARNITITHSFIRAGDDNVALKGGEGGVSNVSIVHNHFYWGHGMSIGSETFGGVSAIRVEDVSLDGPDNGIRIKSNASRGGLVRDVVYDDVCIRNSPNPIVFDTGYTAAGTLEGDRYPTYQDITLQNVRMFGGGRITFDGYSGVYRIGVTLDGVMEGDAAPVTTSIKHTDFHVGPGVVNLPLTGTDMTLTMKKKMDAGAADDCSAKFVPFPDHGPS